MHGIEQRVEHFNDARNFISEHLTEIETAVTDGSGRYGTIYGMCEGDTAVIIEKLRKVVNHHWFEASQMVESGQVINSLLEIVGNEYMDSWKARKKGAASIFHGLKIWETVKTDILHKMRNEGLLHDRIDDVYDRITHCLDKNGDTLSVKNLIEKFGKKVPSTFSELYQTTSSLKGSSEKITVYRSKNLGEVLSSARESMPQYVPPSDDGYEASVEGWNDLVTNPISANWLGERIWTLWREVIDDLNWDQVKEKFPTLPQ
jgi:hypothetical protein